MFNSNMPSSMQAVKHFKVSLPYCWSSLQMPITICKQSVLFFGAQHLLEVPISLRVSCTSLRASRCNQLNASSHHTWSFVPMLQHLLKAAASRAGAALVGVKGVAVGGVVVVRQMQKGM